MVEPRKSPMPPPMVLAELLVTAVPVMVTVVAPVPPLHRPPAEPVDPVIPRAEFDVISPLVMLRIALLLFWVIPPQLASAILLTIVLLLIWRLPPKFAIPPPNPKPRATVPTA